MFVKVQLAPQTIGPGIYLYHVATCKKIPITVPSILEQAKDQIVDTWQLDDAASRNFLDNF